MFNWLLGGRNQVKGDGEKIVVNLLRVNHEIKRLLGGYICKVYFEVVLHQIKYSVTELNRISSELLCRSEMVNEVSSQNKIR